MRRIALVLMLALVVLSSGAQAQEDPPGNPGDKFQDLCHNACATGLCTTQCRIFPDTWTTCGAYWGNPANDLDGDGVSNAADNCTCTANSNQANCDGDARGDACDSIDNSWSRIQIGTLACHIDVDDHIYEEEIEIYYADTYQSACTGATCVKKYLVHDFGCGFTADMNCCLANWNWVDCQGGPWNFDACGTPRCTF